MAENMPKQQKCPLNIFESSASSKETTPDPFEDDEKHGSDCDYDPVHDDGDDSSCNVSFSESKVQRKKSHMHAKKFPSAKFQATPESESSLDATSEASQSNTDDSDCSTTDSIFNTHKRKFSTGKQPLNKKLKPSLKQSDSDLNSIADMSIDSEVLRRNVGDGILEETYLLSNLEDIGDQSPRLLQNPKSIKYNANPSSRSKRKHAPVFATFDPNNIR